jgi:hypothetical protein
MKTESPQMKVREFVESMYPGHDVEVKGYRSLRGAGGKRAQYTAQLFMNGKVVISAQERDWRKAYKTLQIQISKGSVV